MNVRDALADEFEVIERKGEKVCELRMSQFVLDKLNIQTIELERQLNRRIYGIVDDTLWGANIILIDSDEVSIVGEKGTIRKIDPCAT